MADLTLLLVDDSDVDRYIVKRLIKRTGLDVGIIEFCDGREALAWLQQNIVADNDCLHIFLDLNMPLMGGFEFLAQFTGLRGERCDLQPCSVTVLSSSNHPDDLRRSVAYPFVTKHLVKMPTAEGFRTLLKQCTRSATDSFEVLA
jgi:CheY-like chemotaxis protein